METKRDELTEKVISMLREMAKRSAVEYTTVAMSLGVERFRVADIAARWQSAWLQ